MKNTDRPLALKPYLESVEELCESLTKKQLTHLIVRLATDVSVRQRASYLEALRRATGERGAMSVDTDIVDSIDGLVDDIRERQEAIDSGEYWDDQEQFGGWDDEEPGVLSEEQADELVALFDQADGLFLAGNTEEAERAYEALLGIFADRRMEYLDEYAVDVDFKEERARYCRCVYDNRSGEKARVEGLYRAMDVEVEPTPFGIEDAMSNRPALSDVMNARRGKLRRFDAFLPTWRKRLGTSSSERGSILLVEAAFLADGPRGAIRVARERGKRHSAVYPYCVSLLQDGGYRDESITLARAALKVMAEGTDRARVARLLHKVGRRRKDHALSLEGKREELFSDPNDRTLCELLHEAVEPKTRARELDGVVRYFDVRGSDEYGTLHVKALLMTGRLDVAFAKASRGKEERWSYTGAKTGLLYGAVLYALARPDDNEAPTIMAVIGRYAGETSVYGGYDDLSDHDDEELPPDCFTSAICAALKKVRIDEKTRRKYESWARKKADSRITYIVSNKYRRAYGRAAEMLIALAEYYACTGRGAKGREVIAHYRDKTFNRHTAFRGEVDSHLKESTL